MSCSPAYVSAPYSWVSAMEVSFHLLARLSK
ncbi:rCG54428, partial [Rattus norvegicus]